MSGIGKRIKEFRLKKDWTLADLSKHAGIALSTLSRIETGKMTGTLESHIQISRALGIRLTELYAELDGAGGIAELKKNSSPSDRIAQAKGAVVTLLTSGALRKKMLPALVTLQPKKGTQTERGPEGSEKFVYCLKGKIEVEIAQQRFTLEPQDSLYFQALHPHQMKNPGTTLALALLVSSPPSL